MTRDEFQSKHSIESVLASQGIKFVGVGNARKAMCPLHRDKKPSLSIDIRRNVWYCHAGCGNGGVIDLMMKLEGLDFPAFAKKYEIEKSETASVFKNRKKSKLFERARPVIRPQPVEVEESEPEGKPVIEKVYSYQNEFGKEVFQTVRYKPKDFRQRHQVDGEWVWSLKGVVRVLYRLPDVLKAETVILTEGEKDADSLHALGFVATTSPMGSSNWIDSYSDYLKGKDVVICGDNDDAGKDYVQRVFESLSGRAKSVRILELPTEFKDVSDFIASFKKSEDAHAALRDMIADTHAFIKGYRVTVKTMGELQRKYKDFIARKDAESFSLGKWLPDLEDLRALVPGEVVLLVGGTGVGKTALGSSIALASIPLPTLFFELELPDELLFERVISARHKISCVEVEGEFERGFDIEEAQLNTLFPNLFICSESIQTVQDIEEQITHCELKTGIAPKVVVIDYVQLLGGKGDRRERISDAAEEIKRMAKRRRVIVIVISQISRPTEGKNEVSLYDAKESGSLENSSGLVIGIWRDEKDETLLHGRILKATRGRPGRRFRMNFDGAKMLISPRGANMSDAVERVKRSAAG